MSERVEVAGDVWVPFRVMTEAAFPWGLRCAHCERLVEVGQPFIEHTTTTYGNGDTVSHLACVYCPCDEPLVGAE